MENAKYRREEYGEPKHHEQDGQNRGPDPESLRIEDNIAELNRRIGDHALVSISKFEHIGTKRSLDEPKEISTTKY